MSQLNLQLSGELVIELRKTYRYLRVEPDKIDGRPVLQASIGYKLVESIVQKSRPTASDWQWDTIPVTDPPPNSRTVVQIYPNRIWDIEELL